MLNNWFQSRVAVGVVDSKDKGSQYALKWAIDHVLSKGQSVTLIHVSTSMWNNDESLKQEVDRSQPKDIFLPFRIFCTRRGVQCDVVTLYDNDIAKALIEYVLLHRVDTLVLGAASRGSITRLFIKNDIPSIVLKGTPDFCNVYVISKGKIVSGQKALRPLRHISSAEKLTSNFKGETNSMPPFPRDKPMENRASVSSEVYVPDPDISFAGRLSTDSMSFTFDDYPMDSELSPRHSKCSSLESKVLEPFLSQSKSFDLNLSDELTPTQIKSLSAQQIEEMEKKMRRLELELKQTMEMYHSACKVALKGKQKTKELQLLRMKDEKTIEEARRAKEEALEIAEREKALCKAAMDAARAAERMAHREAEKRVYAERKALKEAVAKKMILVSNLGRHHSNENTIPKEKSLVHILVVIFIFLLYIIFALLT